MKTIRAKILICMSLTVLVALGALGVTSIYLNYSSSIDLLTKTMEETVNIASERVTQELNAYMNVAVDAGCTARLADATQSVESKQAIIDQRSSSHDFRRGNIIGGDGISILDGMDYSDREYYQAAMTGVTYISEPLISKVTGELSIIIAAPLWKDGIPNTQVIGVVYFVPTETFLNDIVSDIHISENGAAYAINADGITIADNTMDTIMTQNIEDEAEMDSSLEQLAAVHGKMRKGEAGFSNYQINGVSKFIAYAPVSGTNGWSIGITAPTSDFMNSTYQAIIITVILLVVFLFAAAFVAYRLADGIGLPIKQCVNRLKDLSLGDIKADVPQIKSRDEVGILAEATAVIVTTIRGIITDMGWCLGEMASSNFDIDSKAKELYVGDFQALMSSVNQLLIQLSGTLQHIDQSAEQVSSGSEQVSAGAQALSQGATEQAAAVEELAATVAEISAQVKETASNADMVRRQTDQSGEQIAVSNQHMQEMISSMSEISDKSGQISKIIKTIEDIAFQTNILALNAAVEAARAGDAGKGFAVVADEVRNLASKSSEASKSTAVLIEGTVQAVERGTSIVDATAKSLGAVVESTKEVMISVDKIALAAGQQASSISQVTTGIDQISAVVQTNSATAEESAASSEELSGQAQILKNLVRQFKLKNN